MQQTHIIRDSMQRLDACSANFSLSADRSVQMQRPRSKNRVIWLYKHWPTT